MMRYQKTLAFGFLASVGTAAIAAPLNSAEVASYVKSTVAAEKKAYDTMISSRVKLHGCQVSEDPQKGASPLPTTARFQRNVLETATAVTGSQADVAQAQQLKQVLAGNGPPTLSAQDASNLVHKYLAASRTTYTTGVIAASQSSKCAHTSILWVEDDALPLPSQFLRATGGQLQQSAKISVTLLSEWSISPQGFAKTDFEKKALKGVQSGNAVFGEELLGGKRYSSAAYPDFAVAAVCVDCHNNHKESPKRNFTLGSVMGAVIVRILTP